MLDRNKAQHTHQEQTTPHPPQQDEESSRMDRDRSDPARSAARDRSSLGLPATRGKRKVPPDFDSPKSRRVRLPKITPTTIEQTIERCIVLQSDEGSEAYSAFQKSPTEPPITPESLAQLDWLGLINNVDFRYDVNFDQAISYRPDRDGVRGRRKVDLADAYWKALRAEMLMLNLTQRQRQNVTCPREQETWKAVARASRRRLPRLLEVARDILKTFVPEVEQQDVVSRIDVDLIVQQLDNGVCDLVGLSSWVAKKLKNHCAPMRDQLVDEMLSSLTRGAVEGKPTLQVAGLRRLLDTLEVMKLDLANHQIRRMRVTLVHETVRFHRNWSRQKISLGELDVRGSRQWLEQELTNVKTTTGANPDRLEALSSSIMRYLLLSPDGAYLPATFQQDLNRLRMLRREMQKIACHRICCNVLAEAIALRATRAQLSSAVHTLCTALPAMIDAADDWLIRADHIAVHIVRIVQRHDGRTQSYDSELLTSVERKLQTDLTPMSAAYCVIGQAMLDHLLPKIKSSVRIHENLPALQLQEALLPASTEVTARPFCCSFISEHSDHAPHAIDPDAGIVRRLTHILVLHWQIWRDLVYLAPSHKATDTRVRL